MDEDYLRSPIDDLWTFYYAAQWAAAYNSNEFPKGDDIPPQLKELQNELWGSLLKLKQTEDDPYEIYYPFFRELTDRGVLNLLELMEEHFKLEPVALVSTVDL